MGREICQGYNNKKHQKATGSARDFFESYLAFKDYVDE